MTDEHQLSPDDVALPVEGTAAAPEWDDRQRPAVAASARPRNAWLVTGGRS
jgi:hypothetical protein